MMVTKQWQNFHSKVYCLFKSDLKCENERQEIVQGKEEEEEEEKERHRETLNHITTPQR